MEVKEFFSGIGGMRVALSAAVPSLGPPPSSPPPSPSSSTPQPPSSSSPSEESSSSSPLSPLHIRFFPIDSSELVNQVYRHNFRGEEPRQVNIESLSLEDLQADVWTLSPPCQPFTATRDAKQRHSKDPRNKAFVHLMKMLESMALPPRMIFLENVKGFYRSDVHVQWTETLIRCGYSWRQYLLTPFHFRVPNNRMRFYMIIFKDEVLAESKIADCHYSKDSSVVHHDIRQCECNNIHTTTINGNNLDCSYLQLDESSLHKLHELGDDNVTGPPGVNCISMYLNSAEFDHMNELRVIDSVLQEKWAQGLSYVGKDDRCTFCFTSSYGQSYNRASGSLYHMDCLCGKLVEKSDDMSEKHSEFVRLFAPEELLHLFGFPDEFSFSPNMTLRQKYRAIGQSINIIVVQKIMHSELCSMPSMFGFQYCEKTKKRLHTQPHASGEKRKKCKQP